LKFISATIYSTRRHCWFNPLMSLVFFLLLSGGIAGCKVEETSDSKAKETVSPISSNLTKPDENKKSSLTAQNQDISEGNEKSVDLKKLFQSFSNPEIPKETVIPDPVPFDEKQSPLEQKIAALINGKGQDKYRALNDLWAYATDIGVPDEIMKVLEDAAYDDDKKIARQAQLALNDLEHFRETLSEQESQSDEQIVISDPLMSEVNLLSLEEEEFRNKFDAAVKEALQIEILLNDLSNQAMYGSDQAERETAINTVSLFRNSSATEILLATAEDESAVNRRRSIKALWYSAADGLDEDGRIQDALEYALTDPDAVTANLAKQALEDLERFQKRQETEVQTAIETELIDPQTDLPVDLNN
jgi:hypothetical protein